MLADMPGARDSETEESEKQMITNYRETYNISRQTEALIRQSGAIMIGQDLALLVHGGVQPWWMTDEIRSSMIGDAAGTAEGFADVH